jgi:hypothetical protein
VLGIAHAVGQQMCRFGLTTLVPAREIVVHFWLIFGVLPRARRHIQYCKTLLNPL